MEKILMDSLNRKTSTWGKQAPFHLDANQAWTAPETCFLSLSFSMFSPPLTPLWHKRRQLPMSLLKGGRKKIPPSPSHILKSDWRAYLGHAETKKKKMWGRNRLTYESEKCTRVHRTNFFLFSRVWFRKTKENFFSVAKKNVEMGKRNEKEMFLGGGDCENSSQLVCAGREGWAGGKVIY